MRSSEIAGPKGGTSEEPAGQERWPGNRGPSSHRSEATAGSWSVLLPEPLPCSSQSDAPSHPVYLLKVSKRKDNNRKP